MIKKYVLGLLLVCVAFAGWGQADYYQLDPYSYNLDINSDEALTNALMYVEYVNPQNENRIIYFNQYGDVIDYKLFPIAVRNKVTQIRNSVVIESDFNSIFHFDEDINPTYPHPFSFTDTLEYKEISIDLERFNFKYSNVETFEIQKVQNYLVHFLADDIDLGQIEINLISYTRSEMKLLKVGATVELFPREQSFIDLLQLNGGDILNDYDVQLELLARALFISKDNNDKLTFSFDQYNDFKSEFFNNPRYKAKLEINHTFDYSSFNAHFPDDTVWELRKYFVNMFHNSINKISSNDNNGIGISLPDYDDQFLSSLYGKRKTYFFLYYSYLFEKDYIALAEEIKNETISNSIPQKFFKMDNLRSISDIEGKAIADASLLYLLINFSLVEFSIYDSDIDIHHSMWESLNTQYKILNDWMGNSPENNNSRLFNFILNSEQANNTVRKKEVTDNKLNFAIQVNDSIPGAIKLNEILDERIRIFPYADNGIDTPYLYYNKLLNITELSSHDISQQGVDSYGLLVGSMSIVKSISDKFYSIGNELIAENLNNLNDLNAVVDVTLNPIRVNRTLNWGLNNSEMSRILYEKLKLYNSDIERNTSVVPDYSLVQEGDLIVQYGTLNKSSYNGDYFNSLLSRDDITDLVPQVGIVIYVEQNSPTSPGPALRFWVLSVNEKDGKVSIKPFDLPDANGKQYAVNKHNYVIRRLLVSNRTSIENNGLFEAPISTENINYPWSILSDEAIDFQFKTIVDFNEFFDSADTGEDRWIPNTGYKLGFNNIDFFIDQEIDSTDVEIISPSDPWFDEEPAAHYENTNVYRNKGNFLLEFGFTTENLKGYVLEQTRRDLDTDWLVRFEKKPSIDDNSNGTNNYYIHYNPIYYDGSTLKSSYRLYLKELQNAEDRTHRLFFQRRIRDIDKFYVAVRDYQDPDNLLALSNVAVGDDFLLRFNLSSYNVKSDVNSAEAKLNRLAVYDHKMLWRGNLYICEANEYSHANGQFQTLVANQDYADWNNRYPWSLENNEWNKIQNGVDTFDGLNDLQRGNGGQVINLTEFTPLYTFSSPGVEDNTANPPADTNFLGRFDHEHRTRRVAYSYPDHDYEPAPRATPDWTGYSGSVDGPYAYNKKMLIQKELLADIYNSQGIKFVQSKNNWPEPSSTSLDQFSSFIEYRQFVYNSFTPEQIVGLTRLINSDPTNWRKYIERQNISLESWNSTRSPNNKWWNYFYIHPDDTNFAVIDPFDSINFIPTLGNKYGIGASYHEDRPAAYSANYAFRANIYETGTDCIGFAQRIASYQTNDYRWSDYTPDFAEFDTGNGTDDYMAVLDSFIDTNTSYRDYPRERSDQLKLDENSANSRRSDLIVGESHTNLDINRQPIVEGVWKLTVPGDIHYNTTGVGSASGKHISVVSSIDMRESDDSYAGIKLIESTYWGRNISFVVRHVFNAQIYHEHKNGAWHWRVVRLRRNQ